MANELILFYETGQTGIRANVYYTDEDGFHIREDGITLTESGTTRVYLGDCATIQNGDLVVYTQNDIYLTGEVYDGSAIELVITKGALAALTNFKSYCGITTTNDDILIMYLISQATGAIESYCGRTLRTASYREFYSGDGTSELFANQYPITVITLLSLGQTDVLKINNSSSDAWNAHITVNDLSMVLTINGGTNNGSNTLTLADYTITTLTAAINALGKGWTASVLQSDWGAWAATEIIPCSGLRCFNTTYGYVKCPNVPESDYTLDGDIGEIYLAGNFPKGNKNITLRYTAGYITTPADLEQICIDLVNTYYRSRLTDSTVSSERLGDHSITYVDSGVGGAKDIPAHIQKRLAPYKRWSR